MSTVYIVSIIFWLVVLTILKNISQWEGLFRILWKIKNVWSTGWWYTYPSEKYDFASWNFEIPNLWENKIHVPNHQPVNIVSIIFHIFQLEHSCTWNMYEYVAICSYALLPTSPAKPASRCAKWTLGAFRSTWRWRCLGWLGLQPGDVMGEIHRTWQTKLKLSFTQNVCYSSTCSPGSGKNEHYISSYGML